MTQQIINIGAASNDGTGDPVRSSFDKCNLNFTELYGRSPNNIAINGDFRVNQAGYVSGAVLAAGAYGHDQWKAGASGGNYSFTQLKSSTQITIASGKTLIQPIEDANVVGGSYVLTWTGTAQARAGVNSLTPSGSYAASPLMIAGQTAGTVMSIEFNTGTLSVVKLESGSVATPFIMRPYDQELATCQRYYFKTYDKTTAPGTPVSAGGNGIMISGAPAAPYMGGYLVYPVSLRAAATLTVYSNAGVAGSTSYYTSAWNNGGAAPAISNVGNNSINFTAPTSGVASLYNFDLVADARL